MKDIIATQHHTHTSELINEPLKAPSQRSVRHYMRLASATTGATLAAMIPVHSLEKAEAQTPRVYTCPGAKVAYNKQSQAQFDAAVECVVNAERDIRGLNVLPHSDILARAALWHSQDMTQRRFFSDRAPAPAPYGVTEGERVQRAAGELTGQPLIAPDTQKPYDLFNIFQDITGNNNRDIPSDTVGSYMDSSGHCSNLMDMANNAIGSGTSSDVVKDDGNNTILFTQNSFVDRFGPQTCDMLASIQDPLYVPDTSQRLQVNLKTKQISTKRGKRLQVKIDVDDLKAAGGDKYHTAPIDDGTAVSLRVKRKIGNSAFRTVLQRTYPVDRQGRVATSISLPSRNKWQAEVWYKLAKDKRFNAVSYAASRR